MSGHRILWISLIALRSNLAEWRPFKYAPATVP